MRFRLEDTYRLVPLTLLGSPGGSSPWGRPTASWQPEAGIPGGMCAVLLNSFRSAICSQGSSYLLALLRADDLGQLGRYVEGHLDACQFLGGGRLVRHPGAKRRLSAIERFITIVRFRDSMSVSLKLHLITFNASYSSSFIFVERIKRWCWRSRRRWRWQSQAWTPGEHRGVRCVLCCVWCAVCCVCTVGMGTIDIPMTRQSESQLLAQKVGRVNGQGNYFP